jgi:nitrate reductase beta subunit
MACKSTWTFSKGQEAMWWNNVETKPYGGYPHNWDKKLLALLEQRNPGGQSWDPTRRDAGSAPTPGSEKSPYGRFDGKSIFETVLPSDPDLPQRRALGYLPNEEEWSAPNLYEDSPKGTGRSQLPGSQAQLPEHATWFFYLARICNHCSYPACLAACPRGAIYKRPEDGVVLIDQQRCRGYRRCVEACPYKKSYYRPTTNTSEKCIACYPRLEGRDHVLSPEGEPLETRCMSACVGKIRLQGLVKMAEDGAWLHDPGNPLYYLVREEKVALPLYPQFGTGPNGFYIPPRWVPRPYLQQMFGPGVEEAIVKYSCPSRKLLAVLQLFRATRQILAKFEILPGPKVGESEVTLPDGSKKTLEVFNDTVIGYNKKGREAVRITVEEPMHHRPAQHYNSI